MSVNPGVEPALVGCRCLGVPECGKSADKVDPLLGGAGDGFSILIHERFKYSIFTRLKTMMFTSNLPIAPRQ